MQSFREKVKVKSEWMNTVTVMVKVKVKGNGDGKSKGIISCVRAWS